MYFQVLSLAFIIDWRVVTTNLKLLGPPKNSQVCSSTEIPDVINLTALGRNNSGLTTSESSGNKKPAARKVSAPSRQRRCSLQGCLLNASADFELVKPIQRQPSIVSPKLPTAIARLSQDKEVSGFLQGISTR